MNMKRDTVTIQLLTHDNATVTIVAWVDGPWAVHRRIKNGQPGRYTGWTLTHRATGLAMAPASWRWTGWRLTEARALAEALDDPAWLEITPAIAQDGKHPAMQAAYAQWKQVLAKLQPKWAPR